MAALDRIIGIRTRVLLVLAAIAIGASGAAIYLALQANSDSASQKQLDQLSERVRGGTGATSAGNLETRVKAAEDQASAAQASIAGLRTEVDALRAQLGTGGTGASTGGSTGNTGAQGATGAKGAAGSAGAEGSNGTPLPSGQGNTGGVPPGGSKPPPSD